MTTNFHSLIDRIYKVNTFLIDLENFVDLSQSAELSTKVEIIKEVLQFSSEEYYKTDKQIIVSF